MAGDVEQHEFHESSLGGVDDAAIRITSPVRREAPAATQRALLVSAQSWCATDVADIPYDGKAGLRQPRSSRSSLAVRTGRSTPERRTTPLRSIWIEAAV